MNELELKLKVSASAAEAVQEFGEVKQSLGRIEQAVAEAQTKTAALAKSFNENRQKSEEMKVQVALGRAELDRLADSAGKTSPQYRVLAAQIKQLEGDLKAAEAATGQSEKAFNASRQQAQALKSKMDELSESTHRQRQALQAQGVDVTHLAAEYIRLQREAKEAADAQAKQAQVKQAREVLGVAPHAETQAKIAAVQSALDSLRQNGSATFAEMAQAEMKAADLTDELKKELNGVGGSFQRLKTDVLEFAAALAGLYGASRQAIEFEAGFSQVTKVVDGSDAELAHLREQLIGMTRDIPMADAELLAIAENAGSLGVAADEVDEFTAGVAKLAFAFKMNADQTAEFAAGIQNGFGLSVRQTFVLGDAVNMLGNKFAATERDILNVDARSAAAARTFGLTAEQASALATTLLSLKNPPELAATAINGLLSRLQSARVQSKDFQEALTAVGTSADQMAAAIAKNPQQALDGFLAKLATLDKTSLAEVTSKLIGTGGDATALQSLVQNLSLYQRALQTATDTQGNAGAAQREFDKQLQTTDAQLTLTQNAFKELGMRIGTELLPMIQVGAGIVRDFTQSLADTAAAHPVLTQLLALLLPLMVGARALGAAFMAAKVLFAPLVAAFAEGGAAAGLLSGGLGAVGSVLLRLVGGPFGLAILAATQLMGAWGRLRTETIDLGGKQAALGEVVGAVWSLIANSAGKAVDKVVAWLGQFSGVGERVWNGFKQTAINALDMLKTHNIAVINTLIGLFQGFGAAVGIAVGAAIEGTKLKFNNLVATARAAGRDIRAALSGDFSLSNTTAQVKTNFSSEIGFAKDAVAQMKSAMGEALTKDYVADYTKTLVDGWGKVKKSAGDALAEELNANRAAKAKDGGGGAGAVSAPNPAGGGRILDWGGEGGGKKGRQKSEQAQSREEMQGFEQGLALRKMAYERENLLRDFSKQEEKKYWDGIINTYTGSSATLTKLKEKSAQLDVQILREEARQQRDLSQQQAQEKHDAALSEVALREQAAQQALDLGRVTESEHLDRLREFAAERLEIEMDLLKEKQKLLGDDKLALAKNLADQLALARQYKATLQGIEGSAAKDRKQQIAEIFQPLENALTQSVNGILTGQQTLANAARNAAQSIFLSYLQQSIKIRALKVQDWLFEKLGMEKLLTEKKELDILGLAWDGLIWMKKKAMDSAGWLWDLMGFGAKETAKVGIKAGGESAQVGATIAGQSAQTGAVAAGESARSGITLLGTLKTIGTKAAQAAAGAFSWVMTEVPFPFNAILAPVAAAAAFVGTMAFGNIGSAKQGEWRVQKDGQPYVLHENESVLPSGVADNFRKVVSIVETQADTPAGLSDATRLGRALQEMQLDGRLSAQWGIPKALLKIPQEAEKRAETLTNHGIQRIESMGKGETHIHHHRPITFSPTYQQSYIDPAGAKAFIKTHSREIYNQMQGLQRRFVGQ